LILPACAITPSYQAPKQPKIPKIDIDFKLPQIVWDKWFAEHPLPGLEPVPGPIQPTPEEPEAPEEPETPDPAQLGVPEITEARYTHKTPKSTLRIEWTEVEGAENYEVLITLANGETITYTETGTSVYDTGAKCPQSYSGENGHIAYVKVRAVAGDECGEWSAEETISCDAVHF
ncbi:MAG: hypothetical protein ACI3VN_07870, partial [Candidatus Onthomonas sp.]